MIKVTITGELGSGAKLLAWVLRTHMTMLGYKVVLPPPDDEVPNVFDCAAKLRIMQPTIEISVNGD